MRPLEWDNDGRQRYWDFVCWYDFGLHRQSRCNLHRAIRWKCTWKSSTRRGCRRKGQPQASAQGEGEIMPPRLAEIPHIASELLFNRSNIATGCHKRLYILRAKERSPACSERAGSSSSSAQGERHNSASQRRVRLRLRPEIRTALSHVKATGGAALHLICVKNLSRSEAPRRAPNPSQFDCGSVPDWNVDCQRRILR
jgi:hypothetical protein